MGGILLHPFKNGLMILSLQTISSSWKDKGNGSPLMTFAKSERITSGRWAGLTESWTLVVRRYPWMKFNRWLKVFLKCEEQVPIPYQTLSLGKLFHWSWRLLLPKLTMHFWKPSWIKCENNSANQRGQDGVNGEIFRIRTMAKNHATRARKKYEWLE